MLGDNTDLVGGASCLRVRRLFLPKNLHISQKSSIFASFYSYILSHYLVEMGNSTISYKGRYNALDRSLRRKVHHLLHHWTGWNKSTRLYKLDGENLSLLEHVLVEGVLTYCEKQQEAQQSLSFEYDDKEGVVPKM